MPPAIPALSPRDLATRTLEHQNMLDDRGKLQCCVHDRLGSNRLSASPSLVGGDEYAGLAIVDAIAERLRRKAGEYNGMDGSDTCAGQEGGDSLPCHGQVHGYGVALLHTEFLEHVGDAADFAKQLGVGDLPALTRLICFIDDRSLKTGARDKREYCGEKRVEEA